MKLMQHQEEKKISLRIKRGFYITSMHNTTKCNILFFIHHTLPPLYVSGRNQTGTTCPENKFNINKKFQLIYLYEENKSCA